MACFSPDVAKVEVGKVLGAVHQWATEPVPSQCDQAYSSDTRLRPIEEMTGMSTCRVGELTAEGLGAGAGLWGMATKKTGLRLIKGGKGAKAQLPDTATPSPSPVTSMPTPSPNLPPLLADETKLFGRIFDKDSVPVHGDVMGALTARTMGRIVHEEGALVGIEYRAGETIVRRGFDLKIVEEIVVPPGQIIIDLFWRGVERWKPITVPVQAVGELARDANSNLVKRILRREQDRERRER